VERGGAGSGDGKGRVRAQREGRAEKKREEEAEERRPGAGKGKGVGRGVRRVGGAGRGEPPVAPRGGGNSQEPDVARLAALDAPAPLTGPSPGLSPGALSRPPFRRPVRALVGLVGLVGWPGGFLCSPLSANQIERTLLIVVRSDF
jgi:hypothetical protein